MLDLSNNQGTPDFHRIYQAGQRRVYLKATEGYTFVDRTFLKRRAAALDNHLKVGAYHFARPHNNPAKVEAEFFLRHLPKLKHGRDLRPCLDLEQGGGDPRVGIWAREFCQHVKNHLGYSPILYSYASYLEACVFHSPSPDLWLASYGRNDGKEHSYRVPRPWRALAAHQYSSNCRVVGCSGLVDISHVFKGSALDVPRRFPGLGHFPKIGA